MKSESKTTRLDFFNNSSFRNSEDSKSWLKRTRWYITNAVFFNSPLLLPYGLKRAILRWHGAKVGKGVVIKPHVNIKYPWLLEIGDYSWIGENVWIDNLAVVKIGSHCCLSQGAMLLCGNHDYATTKFDLMVGKITVENGSWIGARSTVTAGVTCHSHSVLSVGSVTSSDLETYTIYRGNPAEKVKERIIK